MNPLAALLASVVLQASPGPTKPSPGCAVPNKPVTAIMIPKVHQEESYGSIGRGIFHVLVHVTPQGAVASATLINPTNDARLNSALLRAVRQGTYSPRLKNCEPIDGTLQLQITTEET
jgi:TonB family protein